ncbi:MAG: tRNA pseudouridine(13) synthase TruD [Candidatus Woesearchaeota archaeon]|nr:MAG: tRNA pseudouridine(13) synthase TruD [Candidatus Woesearchaeota archaeon]
MFTIKEEPEDFLVEEVIDLNLSNGKYIYFYLEKRNYNTVKAIEVLAKILNIPFKNFGFAGNKDKKAITKQVVSVYGANEEKIKSISLNDIKVEVIGRGDKPISLGDLKGNRFEIVVKNGGLREKRDFFINYFGEQRFGKNCDNHLIGKALLKRDFNSICEKLGIEEKNVNGLKKYGIKKIKFYLHSYQSYLFNELLKERIKECEHFESVYCLGEYLFLNKKIKNFKLPLPNFDVEIYDSLLEGDGLTKEAFIFREMPELVSDTVERDVIIDIKDLKIESSKDYYLCKFYLPKGSYATVFLKSLFV